ncbi:MAG TPA: glycosyltransferase family 1 protein [Candidatus Aminicenantes bacterium]|nr:glycosyltransferase family 1 protein [Candidatus Aminicenantes bacterium]
MRNEKKIKVVEVIDRSFLGGGQRHILHLASRLNKHQFEVHVCSSSPGPFIHQVRARDLSHHSIQIGKASLCRSVTALKRLFSQESFDIVHTHGGVAGLVGRWAASRAGIPVIVHTLHGIHYLHYRNPIWKWLMMSQEKLLSRWTNRIICVSEADAQRVLHYKLVPPAKLSVIYNGVEWEVKEQISPQLKKQKKVTLLTSLGVETNNYLVGTVARLHRQKGLIYLFQSFPLIKEKIGNVVLVVVGGGPLEKRFRAFLRKKGWERQIHLLGEQDKVSDYYSAFDLFVLPSLWEGLPLALLEAAQWELPVVATDIGGHREVIFSGRNGLLVSPKDSHSLGDAIIWMNKHPHEAHQFGQELARDIYRRFNLQAMVARIEKIYLDLSK